jgi:hypothetical protein
VAQPPGPSPTKWRPPQCAWGNSGPAVPSLAALSPAALPLTAVPCPRPFTQHNHPLQEDHTLGSRGLGRWGGLCRAFEVTPWGVCRFARFELPPACPPLPAHPLANAPAPTRRDALEAQAGLKKRTGDAPASARSGVPGASPRPVAAAPAAAVEPAPATREREVREKKRSEGTRVHARCNRGHDCCYASRVG